MTERQSRILKLLEEHVYISVNELSRLLFTSPSSIRRDLTDLENLGHIKRSYGGASLLAMDGHVAGFYDRTQKNVREKRMIAERAASLLRNGQSILLDSSTTASFLLPYIARLDSAVLFTNNLETALGAIKHGITTHCIGGKAINGSVSLGGPEAYRALTEISVDIMFFSSQSLSRDGLISDSTEEENFARRIMLDRAQKTVFLCDSSKFDTTSLYSLASLDNIDFAVFDRDYEGLKTKAAVL
jgi:DeoR/GlpR family transcriptional regulator of sugar metabolism